MTAIGTVFVVAAMLAAYGLLRWAKRVSHQ